MHKNARLTPKGREVLVQRLEAGQRVDEVARALGISSTTVRKWWRRHQAGEGLQDRSSRPRRSPRQTPAEVSAQVEALRRQRRTGHWIAQRTGLSPATVSRLLRRAGISRWRELDPQAPARRYEYGAPGDLIHLDIKKLGRIGSPGHRVTGHRSHRRRGIGWDYVHVAVDDHSRVATATIAPDECGETAVAILHQVVAGYRVRGVTVRRIMTDNGSPYVSRAFAEACRTLKLKHIRTRPYTPRTNGKAERFIQTALREWAYATCFETSAQRQAAPGDWLHHYNWHRPHTAAGGLAPISRLKLSQNNLLKLHS